MADRQGEAFSSDKLNHSGVTEIRRRPVQARRWWQFGGKDQSHVTVDDGYDVSLDTPSSDDEGSSIIKNAHNVFEDSEAAELYKPIEGYEGIDHCEGYKCHLANHQRCPSLCA